MISGVEDLITEIDYNGGDNPVYVGVAMPGTEVTEAKWQIRFFEYDAAGNCLRYRFADGNFDFDNIWDNRALLSYS